MVGRPFLRYRFKTLLISRLGLVTITGGKWTTHRKMAEETIDHAIGIAQLDYNPPVTKNLKIHGYHNHADQFGDLAVYGSDAIGVRKLANKNSQPNETLPGSSILCAEVEWRQ